MHSLGFLASLLEKTTSRFIITGVLINAALFGLLELLLRARVDYRMAVTLTYILGMVWGYAQNRLWSWESRAPVFRSFTRYGAVYAAVYMMHLLFVVLLVEGMSVPPLLAAIISSAVLILPIFFLLDRFVFANKKP